MTDQEEKLKQVIESSLTLQENNKDNERSHLVFSAEFAITGDAIDFLLDLYDAEYYAVSPIKGREKDNIQLQVWIDEPKRNLTGEEQ